MEYYEAIKAKRIQAGLSQQELSDKTKIPQSEISRIESGKANPSLRTLHKILEALKSNLNIS